MNFSKKTIVLGMALTAGLFSCKKEEAFHSSSSTDLSNQTSVTNVLASTLNSNSNFMLGINGHSMGVQVYTSISATEQVSILKGMQMTCFRQDVNFNSDGTISSQSNFVKLWDATNAAGITILPMVYTKTLNYGNSESQSYAAGKLLGSNVASKNSKYFKYYELGNELDNKIISRNTSGENTTDYNAAELKITAAYLKGMDDGIKSVQPAAQTMIDASWLHYGFLLALENYGVKFNIIAYHWYSDMEGAAANKSNHIPDIGAKLSGLFNKPIWFTEVGYRPKQVSNNDQLQSDFYTSFVSKCKANSNVRAVLCYELCDEPKKTYPESSYGLLKWSSDNTHLVFKSAALNFQKN